MATKTISIMEYAYEMLAIKEQKNESFSELIRPGFRIAINIGNSCYVSRRVKRGECSGAKSEGF